MSAELPYPLCKHVLTSGKQCQAPALRGKPLCHLHTRNRTLVVNNLYRQRSVGLPPLEDRAAIQIALNEVAAAIIADKISDRKAGKLLWAIQIASQNLARAKEEQLAAIDSVQSVGEHFDEVLIAEPTEEEPAGTDSKTFLDCQFSNRASDQTHEFDPDPPPPPKKEVPEKQCKPFASRREANAFYEQENQWLDQHFKSQAAIAAGQPPDPSSMPPPPISVLKNPGTS